MERFIEKIIASFVRFVISFFYAFVHTLRDVELPFELVHGPPTPVTDDHVPTCLFSQQPLFEYNQAKFMYLVNLFKDQ